MISKETALQASNETTGSLSYINSLVSGATEQGKYFVIIDGTIMNDNSADALRKTYGFNVTKKFFDMGTFPMYKIDWEPGPEIPNESAIFFSCDVDGGARWFYGLLDFKNGQAVGLVDTGLNLSDYYINDSYVLQNKGYAYVFWPNGGGDTKIFFVDSEGSLIEIVTMSTNLNYDQLDGKWFYVKDQNNGVVKAFNGDYVYTLNYNTGYQDFYVDEDWDGATNSGTFQYTLYDGNAVTDSVRLVKPDGTMVEIANLDLNSYWHNCFVYMNYICLMTYESSGDNNILSLKFYDYLGNLIKTIDTSSYLLNNYDFNAYSNSKASILLYTNDTNVNYRLISYDFDNDILVNDSITRGSEYQNWDTFYDSKGVYSESYDEMEGIYYMFYSNDTWINNGFFSYAYNKFVYLEDGDTSLNTYDFENDGLNTKWLQMWNMGKVVYPIFPMNDGDGNLKFLIIKKSGNLTRNTNIAFNDLNDAGWAWYGNGQYYKYTVQNNSDYAYRHILLKYDNTEYCISDETGYNNWWGYYNISIFQSNSDFYYYHNASTNQFTFLSSGVTMNIYNENWYYNSDNIMKSKVILHFPYQNECKVLTEDSLGSTISLPSNGGAYDIEMMKDFFVYLYIDSNSPNYLIAKAYDYSGNLLNTLDTGISNWAEGINSAENRYWFSQYSSSNMLTYHGFGPSTNISVTLSNYNTSYQNMDDYIWWD